MIYHITIASVGRVSFVRDEAERRKLVRKLALRFGRVLLFFCLVDDHLHVVARTERPGMLAESLRRVIASRKPRVKLEEPHWKEVDTRSYRLWMLAYVLTQPEHHGVGVPSALWSGSSFPDLMGLRFLRGFERSVLRAELPRVRQRDLLEIVGLPPLPLEPASPARLAQAGPARIAALAAEVHGADPALVGRSDPVRRARTLAVRAAAEAGLELPSITPFLGCSPRQAQRIAHESVDPKALRALRCRLTLDDEVARRLARVLAKSGR